MCKNKRAYGTDSTKTAFSELQGNVMPRNTPFLMGSCLKRCNSPSWSQAYLTYSEVESVSIQAA